MNRIYRSIRNHRTATCVAVSEIAKNGAAGSACGTGAAVRHGCFTLKVLAASLLLAFGAQADALPVGGVVSVGSASVATQGNTTTVTQNSQNAALNWQGFNIAAGEAVKFVQPNSSAVALNRVSGANPSSILGSLSANGRVFLVNPNGILFGKGAQVNVGGLVASTLNITDTDFMAGRYKFGNAGNGSVANQGTIDAAGGYVALLGATVSNQGVIAARLGTVALAAGNAITLDVAGDGLLNVAVDQGAVHALVQNGGLLQADGGQVLLTAQAAGNLLSTAVNNTGVIQARTVADHNGTIELLGDMQSGSVKVGGTLDASAPNGGNGGFIETNAAQVSVAPGARITTAAAQGTTGNWLIDPQDYTVAASGGDISGAALGAALGTTNVTLQSSSGGAAGTGNVNVDDAVTWGANTTLTLTASNNVNVNASLTATGAGAGLAINPNTANGSEAASGSGTFNLGPGAAINLPNVSAASTTALSIGGVAYTVINSLGAAGSTTQQDLQGMSGNLAGHYALGSNIDASATSSWNGGAGFAPVGTDTTSAFSGTFNGLGHTIGNLTINQPTASYVGLFGVVGSSGTVANVGLAGGTVAGNNNSVAAIAYVGALVGDNLGTINNSYAAVDVSGNGFRAASPRGLQYTADIGGLVGNNSGTIRNSHATGALTTGNYSQVGGLAGQNSGFIGNSYATGTLSSSSTGSSGGGLVGVNSSGGSITGSYATGNVLENSSSGGLVSSNSGSISGSYATGSVTGNGYGAGLVSSNNTGGSISDSYAIGSVSGSGPYLAGLVADNGGTISHSYATGAVTGGYDTGGLIGLNAGSVIASYWNSDVNANGIGYVGVGSSSTATGLTTAQMMDPANFAGLDFTNTWTIYSSNTDPLLRSFMTPLTVTANNAVTTYDGNGYSGGNGVGYSGTPNLSNLLGTPSYAGSAQGAVNAGSYSIAPSGLYSNQQGYLISYADGTLTVNPKALTISGADVADKVYDGTTAATVSGGTLSGVVGSDVVTLNQGTAAFASANAGTGIAVILSDSLSGSGASNYTLLPSLTGNITPAALTITAADASRAQGGTDPAFSASYSGFVDGQTPAVLAGLLAFNTPATSTSPAGSYALAPYGQSAANYAITYINGTLTVTAAATPAPTVPATAQASAASYQNVIGSVVATTSATTPQGSQGDQADPRVPALQTSVGATAGVQPGWVPTVTDFGIKLPPGVQVSDATAGPG